MPRGVVAESGRQAELLAKKTVYWPITDFGGTGTDSGCVQMRRDASRMRPDASGCVGILNSNKLSASDGKIPATFGQNLITSNNI